MNFELTEEQKVIQKAARDFAQGEFEEDLILELQQKNKFPYGILEKACKLGFIGISYPVFWGGQDYGLLENVLIIEEFCRKDSGVGIALSSVDMGTELILKFGDEKQKEKFLRPITKGKAISSLVYSITEDGGSSSNVLLTRRSNDRYILSGEGAFVLNGSLADFFIVHCKMNSEETKSAQYNQFAVIEKNSHGLNIIDMGDKLGMGMLPWNKILFNDAEISEDEILGRIDNNHFNQLEEIQKVIMVKNGAQALGIAQGAFDQALAYSKKREQFGKKIGEFQGIRHKLVDMHIKIQATRLLVYSVASLLDRRKIDLCDTTTAKLYAEITAVEVTDEALQIFGGAGYMVETPVEHFFRDARIMRTNVGRQLPQKNIIAHSIMGNIT